MLQVPSKVLRIINLLKQNGAKDVFIVGGFVRDYLLGLESKDIDIEVYGCSYSQIIDILTPLFHVDFVGQSFGVIKVDNIIDIALPRRESKNGLGHKGFSVETVPDLSPEEAFARRDFTINAIGMRENGTFYDPFDGRGDLKRKILRAPSRAFKDDPLRPLRGMQFAARFGLQMDPQTIQYSKEAFTEFNSISKERIYGEWEKWAFKGAYPSKGLQVLVETGWIKGFPELEQLVDHSDSSSPILQCNCLETTGLICDELVKIIQPHNFFSRDEIIILMLASLCHKMDRKEGLTLEFLSSSEQIRKVKTNCNTLAFLKKINAPKHIVGRVVPLVLNSHIFELIHCPTEVKTSRLSVSLAPASIKLWFLLCSAIQLATPSSPINSTQDDFSSYVESIPFLNLSGRQFSQIALLAKWFYIAKNLNISESVPIPLVSGRDLLDVGFKPSKEMGAVLKRLYDDQLNGLFHTKEEGLDRVKQYI